MEASNLPETAYEAAETVKRYQKVQEMFHKGCILPIGQEPDGRSWTGFQSILNDYEGFLLVYREENEKDNALVQTWLQEGDRIVLTPIFGEGPNLETTVQTDGKVQFTLSRKNDYQLYRYQRK